MESLEFNDNNTTLLTLEFVMENPEFTKSFK